MRTPVPARERPPPICSRHEPSSAVQTSRAARLDRVALVGEHRARRVGVLDRERAAEAAALVGARQLHQLEAPHARSSRSGASPTRVTRSEWQVGWYATRCGKRAPTSSTPSRPTSSSDSSNDVARAPERSRAPSRRTTTTARRRLVPVEDRERSARARRVRLVAVAAVQVHLPAAGLLGREHDLVAEPLEHRDRRPRSLRESVSAEAGDEERDPHVSEVLTG